jgi:crossover junction endodeoxyribonuclease RuvC
MIILGLDLGSRNVGFSIIETDDASEKETLVTLVKAEFLYLAADKIGDRLLVVLKRLEKEIEDNLVDLIVYENSVFKGRQAPGLYQVAGIFELLGAIYNIPVYDPKPTQIKKLIADNGKADKKDIEIAANKWLTNPQESFENHHVSDSVSIALYGYLKYCL